MDEDTFDTVSNISEDISDIELDDIHKQTVEMLSKLSNKEERRKALTNLAIDHFLQCFYGIEQQYVKSIMNQGIDLDSLAQMNVSEIVEDLKVPCGPALFIYKVLHGYIDTGSVNIISNFEQTNNFAHLKSLNIEETKQFLKEKIPLLNTDTLDLLESEKVNGAMAITFRKEDFQTLNIPLNFASELTKFIEKYLIGNDMIYSNTTTNQDHIQKVRPFGEIEANIRYKYGNIIPHESGGGNRLEEPAREFKRFDMPSDKPIHIHEKSFIERHAKFSISCLNRRTNGTIYFGVNDSHGGKAHGEICGVKISKGNAHFFEDWCLKHLKGSDPTRFQHIKSSKETLMAIRQSIHTIKIIPVDGTEEDTFIIECDIEPNLAWCKSYLGFSVLYPFARKTNNYQPEEPTFFVREGKNSIGTREFYCPNEFYTKTYSIDKKNYEEFFNNELPVYCNARFELEKLRNMESKDLNIRLDEILNLYGKNFKESHHRYFLVTNGIMSPMEPKYFEWLTQMDWYTVFDFSHTSYKEGMCDYIKKANIAKASKFWTISDLEKAIDEDSSMVSFLQEFEYGEQMAWITGTKYNDISSTKELSLQNWNKKYKNILNNVLNIFCQKRNRNFASSFTFVIPLFQDTHLNILAKFCSDIISTMGGVEQLLVVHDNNELFTSFEKIVLANFAENPADLEDPEVKSWKKQTMKISWIHFNDYIKGKVEKITGPDLQIVTTSGTDVFMDKETVKTFRNSGIEIIGTNMCNDLSEDNKKGEKASMYTKEFLSGKRVRWELFKLSDNFPHDSKESIVPVVERTHYLDRIVKAIAEIKKRGPVVGKYRIIHHPGSGATTLAYSVIWKLKTKFRCAKIDGDQFTNSTQSEYMKLTGNLINFFNFKENDNSSSPKTPILLLIDNSSEQLVNDIRVCIENKLEHTNIVGPAVILLYLIRKYQNKELKTYKEKHSLELPLKIHQNEQELFLAKAKQYLDDPNIHFEVDMLHFVIMAAREDEDNVYVQRVVKAVVSSLQEVNPLQKKLLIMLSILKYYANLHLSLHHCEIILKHQPLFPVEMCSQLQPFVKVQEKVPTHSKEKITVWTVSNIPIAKQVLKLFCDEITSKIELVKDLFLNMDMRNTNRLTEKLNEDIKVLLVRRQTNDQIKDKFSKFVLDVMEHNAEEATALLEKAFDYLIKDSNNSPIIAQAIARLNIHIKRLDVALKWANIATDISPHNHTCYDTKALVYKHHMYEAKNDAHNFPLEEMELVFSMSIHAIETYKKAIQKYNEEQKRYKNHEASNRTVLQSDKSYVETINSSIIGQIGVINTICGLIIEKMKTPQEKDIMRSFLRNEDVDITGLVKNIPFWNDFSLHLREMYPTSSELLKLLIRKFDSHSFISSQEENMKMVAELSQKMEDVFMGTTSKDPFLEVKHLHPTIQIKYARETIGIRQYDNIYWMKNEANSYKAFQYLKKYRSFCSKHKEAISNTDKICMINLTLSYNNEKLISFNEAQIMSSEVVCVDVPNASAYFAYVLLHWPCDLNIPPFQKTYDEKKIIHALRRLKQLSEDQTSIISIHKNEFRRNYRIHEPIFFLSRGKEFSKVVPHIFDGELYPTSSPDHKKLNGCVSSANGKRYIEVILPLGEKLRIRPAKKIGGTDSFEVTFELAFTLKGLVAYNWLKN